MENFVSKYKWWLIIGGLTLLLVVFLIIYFVKKRKQGSRISGDDNLGGGLDGSSSGTFNLQDFSGGTLYEAQPGTRDFGMKLHPISKTYKMHYGIDFKNAGLGVPYVVINPGVVTDARMAGACGNMLIVKHDNGVCTKVCHLDKMFVKKGDRIDKPTIVGNVGNTGGSTGPHLHWEYRPNCGDAVDGKPYINDYFRFMRK